MSSDTQNAPLTRTVQSLVQKRRKQTLLRQAFPVLMVRGDLRPGRMRAIVLFGEWNLYLVS